VITSKPATPAGSEGAATTDKKVRLQNQAPNLDALIGIVDGAIDEHETDSANSAGSEPANLQVDTLSTKSKTIEPLPTLRPELVLENVQFDKKGQPHWTLQDPIRGKYYRIGWLEFELLSRWSCNDVDALVRFANDETTLNVNRGHVESLITMLTNNELIQFSSEQDLQQLESKSHSANRSLVKSAFSFSMFYRKPLINPDALLTRMDRKLAPFYAHKYLLLTLWATTAAVVLYGIGAHWYEFRNTFSLFMTIEGFALFVAVLIVTNTLHEFGHGLIAKHYRCRVTEMGVALIFMLPVCYCDTSDTWRLTDRRQRLLVSAGGLFVELGVATIACLFWLLLPDGIPRTLMFFVAVTSLATSFFINLNPFMKFDGYYLLSDALGVDNLQTRSFANFRWQLRRWLTGSAEDKPHRIPESSHAVMNLYAASTWLYRLILYFTICWMVYQFWFKALGLLLMTGVFITMIVKPVAKEAVVYGGVIKKEGVSIRTLISGAVLLVILMLLVVPLPRKVSAPAMLSSGHASKVFATRPAQVASVHVEAGDKLSAGQAIITLTDPALEYEKHKLTQQLETLKQRKLLETQWLAKDVSTQVSDYDIEVYESSLQEVQEQIESLRLEASIDSTVTSVPLWLREGVWVNTNEVLAELASSQSLEVRAYVPAAKRDLLEGKSAKFYATSGADAIDLQLVTLANTNIDVLDDQSLAVANGGVMAVVTSAAGELQPVQGWMMAILSPSDEPLEINSEKTGYVMFPAIAKSLAASVFDRLYGVVIRESGF